MSTVGWGALPISVSLRGMQQQINQELKAPMEKAAKEVSDTLQKGVGSGVDAAAKQVEKSQYRVKKATEELKDAESKRNSEILKSQAAVKQLEAAEAKLVEIKKSGSASAEQLAKAEADVLTKRGKVESAANSVEKAERGVEKAMAESARASESLTKAQKDLEAANNGSADSAKDFGKAAEGAEGATGRLEASLSQLAITATAIIGAVGAAGKAAYDMGAAFDDAYDTIRVGTGASGASFEGLQDSLRKVAGESIGVGSDLGEIGTTLADLNTRLGVTGEPLEKLTAQFQQLKGMGMETDINAVTGAFTQFGVQAEQMPGMMDTLFQISQATGRSMNDLVGNLSKSGPALQEFGFGLTESAGLLGALDKAGLDADKTMQSMTKALSEFAKNGEDPQQSLWNMIRQIDELVKAGESAEAIDLANSIFGARGGTGFVAAVESGAFAYNEFMESLGASSDTIEGLAGETASFAEKWDQLKLRFMLSVEPMVSALFDGLAVGLDVVLKIMEPFTSAFAALGDIIKQNAEWMGPLIAAVTAAGGAWLALNGAIVAWQAVTKVATPVMAALKGVMVAGPIMGVVAAIAALVGGLTYFFTKTEKGKEVWAQFTDFLGEAWDKTVGKLQAGFEVIKSAWQDVTSAFSGGGFSLPPEVMDFLVRLRDTVLDIGKTLGDALITLGKAVLEIKMAIGGALWEVLKGVFGLLQELWKFLAPVLKFLAKFIGGALLGVFFALSKVIQSVVHALSGLATGFSWLVEKVLAPVIAFVGRLVGAFLDHLIPALKSVAGFVVNILGQAFSMLGQALMFTWSNIIKPVFNALVTVAQWVVQILLTAVIAPIKLAWDLMAASLKLAWESIIKPTFEAFGNFAKWVYENVLLPAFDGVKIAFQVMADGLRWIYDNVIKPVLDALGSAVTWLYQNVIVPSFDGIRIAFQVMADALRWIYDNTLKPIFDAFVWLLQMAWEGAKVIFDAIIVAFQAVGEGFRWVYDNIIRPVIDAFASALRWLHDNVVAPVLSWIGDKWRLMGDGFNVVKNFIVDTVFGGLKSGLDRMQGWFGTAVDAISRIWQGIKRATAKPVRFVVETVFNNGIMKAWNAVATFTGLKKLEPVRLGDLGQYAHGGVLPGYTPGRDPYEFVEQRTGMRIGLSGGEAILRPEATKAFGQDWVDSVNNVARKGGVAGVRNAMKHSHFASGGVINLGNFANGGFTNLAGALTPIQQSMGGFVGRFFPGMFNLTSATRYTDNGYHSRGMAADWQAKDGQFATQMPTPNSRALARAIYKNFRNSTELIHWPESGWTNLKNGQHLNYGAATNAGHQNHIHWAITSPLRFNGEEITLDTVPGEGGGGWNPLSIVKGIWDGIINKIGKFADAASHGLIGELPGAMAKKLIDSAWEKISKKVSEEGAYHGAVGGGVEQWRSMVVAVLKDKGFSENLADTVLRRMNQESGGNPRALNNWDINAKNGTPSKGLMQVIDPTFAANKDPGYDNIWDPEANLRASMNYAIRRYGSLPSAYNRAGGYASGGVLPGFTPGRDVHHFFSSTGGALSLSGGESIMVPEWTAMQGGPAAVERMNRAARAGRASVARSGVQAFADGGTYWGPIGARQRKTQADFVAALDSLTRQLIETGDVERFGKRLDQALVPVRRELEIIANANTLEGIAARAAVSQGGEIAGMLGLKSISTVTATLLDAEQDLLTARSQHADRLADISAKEKALSDLRKQLQELETGKVDLDVKDQRKLKDAEDALAAAKKEAGKASEKAAEKVEEAGSKTKDAAKASELKAKSEEQSAEKTEKANDKVTKAEEKLRRVREDLGLKAEKEEEKREENIKKTKEEITKAEDDLTKARKESAKALDMLVYEVDPSIYHGLMDASRQITAAIPDVVKQLSAIPGAGQFAAQAMSQTAGGLAQLASVAGPAGISVGVAIQHIKTAIDVFQKVAEVISGLVVRTFEARKAAFTSLGEMFNAVRDLSKLTRELRAQVVGLIHDQALATIALADAQRNQRIVAMEGVRAQMKSALTLANAWDEFEAARREDVALARQEYIDLTNVWGRWRHEAISGTEEAIEVTAKLSDRSLVALYRIGAADMDKRIAEKQAAEANLKAQWEATIAAFDLREVTRDLGVAAEKLAIASGKTFGMTEVDATVNKRWSDLQAEIAELEAWKADPKTWMWAGNWGAMAQADRRIKQIREELAEIEGRDDFTMSAETSKEIQKVVSKSTAMGFFGGAQNVAKKIEWSAAGDAGRALERIQWETDLIDKKAATNPEKLRDEIERKRGEREFKQASGNLATEIHGLELIKSSYETMAEMYSTSNVEARVEMERLAKTQAVHGREIVNLANPQSEKVVQMPTDKRAFSADEVEWMLGELDVRVEKLERPKPSAALVAASRR